MPHATTDLLTPAAVGRLYPGARGAAQVSAATVVRWITDGCPARDGRRIRLTATRCGGRWLVRPADLDDFFAALGQSPGTAANEPDEATRSS